MSKSKRKLSRKFKRTVGIGVASLFLVSAIVVALIPQNGTKAYTNTDPTALYLTDADNGVPEISATDQIYTSEDGTFQFAYIPKKTGMDKVAVICGYDKFRSLDRGKLVVPDYLDAYMKYTDTHGTTGGYIAVSKSNDPLYYERWDYVQSGVDVDNNPIYDWQASGVYLPCYAADKAKWEVNHLGETRAPEEFFYETDDGHGNTVYKPTDTSDHQWIQGALVNYIANQNVEKTDSGWVLSSDETAGIFAGAANITDIYLGEQLLGIGNYAFANCTNINSITLYDGCGTIGNYAFANCKNLKTISMPYNTQVSIIGERAFYDCESLESFALPDNVNTICDSAFEDCFALKTCSLEPEGYVSSLTKMGKNVFKNCNSLESLTFPASFTQNQDVCNYEGCLSLKSITANNANLNFVEDEFNAGNSSFGYDEFKNTVPEEFYFEGHDGKDLHQTSKANAFAFKYLGQEIYEKVLIDPNATGSKNTVIFQVDNNDTLLGFEMGDDVVSVVIPGTIGPYCITKIGAGFKDNDKLTSITIPSSITEIEAEAFKGCHRLKDVIFEEPINLTYIGDSAFDTQTVSPSDTCTLDNDPVLSFTGVAEKGSAPFDYAMDPNNNINNANQTLSYITFYTGWPSIMAVKYNPVTDKNELIDVPTKTTLQSLGSSPYDYPFLTPDLNNAAHTAVSTDPALRTDNQKTIVNSYENPVIPSGVESIKEGLFSGKDVTGASNGITPKSDMITITSEGLDEIDPHAFDGLYNLKGVYVNGDTKKIGDYAFKDCLELQDVDINAPLDEMGIAPFYNDTKLTDVDFKDDSSYDCDKAIIYALDSNGKKQSVVEVLPARGDIVESGTIDASELEGVSAIKPSAFENCPKIQSVDMTKSKVEVIPVSCFENTPALYSVLLSEDAKMISEKAFKDSNISYISVPKGCSIIDSKAFQGDEGNTITFYCEPGSPAAYYASQMPNAIVTDKPIEFVITFYDDDGTYLDSVKVMTGESAVYPKSDPVKPGYVFKGWFPSEYLNNVKSDNKVYASYQKEDDVLYTVRFIDHDGTVLNTQKVKPGEDAIEIKNPERTGYTFVGWMPSLQNIQKDTDLIAIYEKGENGGQGGQGGQNGSLYTVTVVGGSGSGSYVAGANVTIIANNPEAGKVFDKWTYDEGVSLAKADMAATIFSMPSKNITITANYKASGNNNGNNGNGNNNNNGNATKPNTTVNLTKGGFSNNGLASATVNGSSDNFVLKITDSQTAKAEIEDALLTEYGSLDNIKYVAMDISLYDSTGTTKIKNTDDLKVSITIPIPDDLVGYAGNNKVAYVVNGKLVKLAPKFTTINGVPCMTFVAPHFSPYTIYVDTTDLSSSVTYTNTSTPKTGDGIAVKWFISLGLFAASVLFFALAIPSGKKKVSKG